MDLTSLIIHRSGCHARINIISSSDLTQMHACTIHCTLFWFVDCPFDTLSCRSNVKTINQREEDMIYRYNLYSILVGFHLRILHQLATLLCTSWIRWCLSHTSISVIRIFCRRNKLLFPVYIVLILDLIETNDDYRWTFTSYLPYFLTLPGNIYIYIYVACCPITLVYVYVVWLLVLGFVTLFSIFQWPISFTVLVGPS